MTHVLEVTKAEFTAVKGEVLNYLIVKANKRYADGDTVILQETTSEGHQTGQELHTTISNLNQGEAIKKGWILFNVKEKERE
jgi:hypothetical protein